MLAVYLLVPQSFTRKEYIEQGGEAARNLQGLPLLVQVQMSGTHVRALQLRGEPASDC